jgi:hypothetical protein
MSDTCPKVPGEACPLCTAQDGEECPLAGPTALLGGSIGGVPGATCDASEGVCEACQ